MGPARNNRRGSALVLALLVVSVVAALSVGLLQLNGAVTKRQSHSIDDMRAFYLAEAGLSEAYFGLMTGKSGQIGSLEAPALAGDGLVWVDAIEEEEGVVRLRSTGLCQAGRSTLEIVVRREETPLGIFADEGIDFATPFLLDGYDAEASAYHAQSLPSVSPQPGDYVHDNLSVSVVRIAEMYYDYVYKEGNEFFFVDSVPRNPITRTIDARDYFEKKKADLAASGVVDLGPTTGDGGMLGSNGPISLSAGGETVEVYGDVVPGTDESVDLGWGVSVTGETTPRDEPLELAPVTIPNVDMLPGFVHSSAIPRVLPPAEVGYDSISVASGSELVVQGEGNLVVGDLLLQDGGAMTVENGTGPVNLYVTDSADFVTGSSVTVESQEPADLSLQAGVSALALNLRATSQFHGMVYAPDSHVAVGRDFEIFGMLVGNTLEIDPMARLHFDSGVLGNSGAVPMPRLMSWRIEQIPAQVAQSRIDPFRLLNLNKDDLQDLTDAHEQASWFVTVWANKGAPDYEGPLEQWVPPPGSDSIEWLTLTPPEVGNLDDWHLYVRYRKTKNGSIQTHDGPVADIWMPFWVAEILEFRVDPPQK